METKITTPIQVQVFHCQKDINNFLLDPDIEVRSIQTHIIHFPTITAFTLIYRHKKGEIVLGDLDQVILDHSKDIDFKGKRKRKKSVGYIRLENDQWKALFSRVDNGLMTEDDIVSEYGVGRSTTSVKRKKYDNGEI